MSVRLHSLKTPAIVLASLYAAYLVFGWLALPRILESQAKQYIAEKTGHRLTLDRPAFNPFNLKLSVSNLHLEEPDGKQLFAFRQLIVDVSASSIYRRALVFDAIRLDEPEATVVLKSDGRLNWRQLIEGLKGKEAPKGNAAQTESALPRFDIQSFIMTGGRIDFADQRTGFSTRFNPLDVELNDISSLPNDRDRYRISARSNGARIIWQGQSMLSPLEFAGSLAVEGLDLSRLVPYAKTAITITSASGIASLSADYRVSYAGGRFDLFLEKVATKVTDFRLSSTRGFRHDIAVDLIEATNGRFDLFANKFSLGALSIGGSRINLPRSQGAPVQLLQLGRLTLDRLQGDAAARRITIDHIAFKDGRLRATREARGQVDVLDALRTAVKEAKGSTRRAKTLPWHYRMNKVELAGFSASFRDEAVSPAADLMLDDIAVSVDGISDNYSAPVPIRASARSRDGGEIKADGKIVPADPSANLDVKVVDLALKPAQPYVASVARLRLANGRFNTEGRATYAKRGAIYTGRFAVRDLRLVETDTKNVFLAWKLLGSRRFEVTPAKLDVGTLDVVRLDARLVINKDKSVNIIDILRRPGAVTASSESSAAAASSPIAASSAAPTSLLSLAASAALPEAAEAPAATSGVTAQPEIPSTEAGKKAPSFLVNIDRVKVTEGEMDFADYSLVLPFETRIHDLHGYINGVSSRPAAPGQIELDGRIDNHGVARGVGQIEFFRPTDFTDVTVIFSNVEMTRLSPYSTTFAGRKIDSGKLLLNLEYKIKGRQLAGENKIVIDKVVLGDRVQSPEAIDLPLDMAVAILQDSDGRIDLGVPVSGSLDDPEFSYGRVIWKAVLNIFKMIATAPFRALGALFGGGVKIDNVYFDPGTAKLSPPEQENVIRLAGVLNKRPGLSMTVHGAYSDADRVALQDLQLRRAVAAEAGIEVAPDEDPGPLSTGSPKVQAALESLFKDRIGGAELDALKDGFREANPGQLEESGVGKILSGLTNLFRGKRTLSGHEVEQLKGADFYVVLFQRLREREPVSDAQMQALAMARGKNTLAALEEANAPADRLALGAPVKAEPDAKGVALKLDLGTAQKPPASASALN